MIDITGTRRARGRAPSWPGATAATMAQHRVRAAHRLERPELDAIADLLAVLDRAARDLPAEVRSAYDQVVVKLRCVPDVGRRSPGVSGS